MLFFKRALAAEKVQIATDENELKLLLNGASCSIGGIRYHF
ncbi:hypothetical protein [Lactobacillus sp. UCMA15818]|nr:hypothetical protein [Lactobacillus sp. UCMA15818]